MLHKLRARLERRRSSRAILTMINGLFDIADDWVFLTSSRGIMTSHYKVTSDSLGVALKWAVWDGIANRHTKDWKLTLGGVEQDVPAECWDKLDKRTQSLRRTIDRRRADRKLAEAETKLAQWVVDNHRTIRRVELGHTHPSDTIPGPKELKGGKMTLLPGGLTGHAPIGHLWCGRKVVSYRPGPDLYVLDDDTTVPGGEVRCALRVAA